MNFKYLLVITLLFLVGCQKETLEIIEAPEDETSFLFDQQLTSLIKSVAAHDGSFDDVIDKSSCFSIDIPYQIELNGAPHNVNTVDDLLAIKETDQIELVYPLNLNFADYAQQQVLSNVDFEELILACAEDLLFNDRITCVDFQYPIRVKVYNTTSNTFETLFYEHDKMTFQSIVSFAEDELATIEYPISIIDRNGLEKIIQNNDQLKQLILDEVTFCE